MRRRRQPLRVSTFPFLAVLLCAMGALLFVLLAMDRKARQAAQAKAQDEARALLDDQVKMLTARRSEYESRKRVLQQVWEKKRDALLARVGAEESALQAELRAVQARLARVARRVQDEEGNVTKLRQQLQNEQARLLAQKQDLESARKEAIKVTARKASTDQAKARLTDQLLHLEQSLKNLKEERKNDSHTFSVIPYFGKQGQSRRPLYIECAAAGVLFHPEKLTVDASAESARVRSELQRRANIQRQRMVAEGAKDTRPYVMLLVRPDGIQCYYRMQTILRELALEFGYEFVDADWILKVPEDGPPPPPLLASQQTGSQPLPATPPGAMAGHGSGLGGGQPGIPGTSNPAGTRPAPPGGTGIGLNAPVGGRTGEGGLGSSKGGVAAIPGTFPGMPGTPRAGAPNVSLSGIGPFGSGSPGAPGKAAGPAGFGPGPGAAAGTANGPTNPGALVGGSSGTDLQSVPPLAGGASRTDLQSVPPLAGTSRSGPSGSGGLGQPAGSPPGIPQTHQSSMDGSLAGTNRSDPSGSDGSGQQATGGMPGGLSNNPKGEPVTVIVPPAMLPTTGNSAPGPRPTGSEQSSVPPPPLGSSPPLPPVNDPAGTPRADTRALAQANPPGSAIAAPGTPRVSGGGNAGGGSGEGVGFAPPPPVPTRKPINLRPALVGNDATYVIFVECLSEYVVMYPSRLRVPIDKLNHSPGFNPLFKTIEQMIARRLSTLRPGEKPPHIQVRFLVHNNGERTLHLAYPVLNELQIEKVRYSLQPEDDVNRIIANY